MKETTQKVSLANKEQAIRILGKNDKFLHIIEKGFNINIIGRGNEITLKGKNTDITHAKALINKMLENDYPLEEKDILLAIRKIKADKTKDLDEILKERIEVSSKRKYIAPKNLAQTRYIQAIKKNEIVFSIGPAGTGKTYLAMAMAVNYLITKKTSRVILVRPAVEAGEKLGFLPGDLHEKITPYLRPLYDAIYEMLEVDKLQQYLDKGVIEIAPLAYMRGRTFNDSFIIMDEAQNSTSEQMKMFLTRLGFDSKVIVTGDITQVDLPGSTTSGLIEIQHILKGIKGIDFVYFTGKDVVRHKLVQEIIRAYDKQKKGQSA